MTNFFKLSAVTASVTLLIACGGGSNVETGSAKLDSPALIQGVAAVGAPISGGTLFALDADGKVDSTPIKNDGTYTVDFLSDLKLPVLLRAEGVSGGRTVIHFGAVTQLSDTTVNVTPVSTAVVAQVMQADPGAVFELKQTGKIALLTAQSVNASSSTVGDALAPAKSAAEIEANTSIDFLNTPFAADKTGLDKLLDLVKVSVQPDRRVLLSNKTADGVTTISTDGSSTGSLGTVNSIDTKGIDVLGQSLQEVFQDPELWKKSDDKVLNLFSESFKHGGMNREAVIKDIAEDADDMFRSQILPAKILNCHQPSAGTVCEVLFTVNYSDGGFEPFIFPVILENENWKIYGDQAPVHTSYGAVVYRNASDGRVTTRSGFNITIFDDAVINNIPVGYAKAWFGTDTTGPAEFVFVNPRTVSGSCNGSNPGYLNILSDPTNLNSCGGNFAELSDDRIDELRDSFSTVRPKITVKYYDKDFDVIEGSLHHTITIESLPLKPNEVPDGNFATITAESWDQFSPLNLGNEFTLTVSKGLNVGLEDVVGARPTYADSYGQNLDFTLIRTGSSWDVVKANNYLITVTRDSDGRMYWYQRQ